jgi:hypothetical protein
VALIGESLAARDAQRGEDAPAAEQTSLPGRKANFLDGQQSIVMKDVGVNHQFLAVGASDQSILYPKNPNASGQEGIRRGGRPLGIGEP